MNLDAVPAALRARPQWVDWRSDPEKGKIPVNPRTGNNASTDKPATWGTLKAALAGLNRHPGQSGVGFVFTAADEFVGVDLDNCLEEDGTCKAWALPIRALFPGAYTEITPSGRGLHIITVGTLPANSRNKVPHADGHVEAYDRLRFFTMTGRPWGQAPEEITGTQEAIEELVATVMGVREPERSTARAPSEPVDLDDRALLERMFASRNAHGIEALWHGDTSEHGGDDSRADLALCNHLAFWTNRDAARMDRLFRESGLYREKWDREDYRARTIERALAGTTEGYRMPRPREAVPMPSDEDAPAGPTDWVAMHEPERRANEARRKLEKATNGKHPEVRAPPAPYSAAYLQTEALSELEWIVPNLLMVGATLLIGHSKLGKSFLALGIAVAVAMNGKALGKLDVKQGGVLYIALEDGKRRVKKRLGGLLENERQWPENLLLVHEWPTMNAEGRAALVAALEAHPGIKLVVIDTWNGVRSSHEKGGDLVKDDYDAVGALRKIGEEHGCAIVIVHHASQHAKGDWVNAGASTHGMPAAADAVLVLERKRGEDHAVLKPAGKDLDTEEPFELQRDTRTGFWTIAGQGAIVIESRARREIYAAIAASVETAGDRFQGALTAAAVAQLVHKKRNSVLQTMRRMAIDAELVQVEDGLYTIPHAN